MPDQSFDPLAENARAFQEFAQNSRPPDSDGRDEEIADLSALHRGPGVSVEYRQPPPQPVQPSLILEGGDRRSGPSRDARVIRP